jgi:hypothetical protein
MEDKKQLLENLKKRNDELHPIVFKSFDTEQQLDKYSKGIQKEIDEYYDNQEKINQLKYELMSPKEREEYDEYMRKLKLKAEGKKFW